MRSATVDLKVARSKLHFELTVPAGVTRKIDLLPLFRSLADTILDAAANYGKSSGYTISCREGCGA